MIIQTESKAQGWRALAKFEDGREALLLLALSSQQIRAGYLECFRDLLDEEEQDQIVSISMQRWHGAPDAGCWEHQSELKHPSKVGKMARVVAA